MNKFITKKILLITGSILVVVLAGYLVKYFTTDPRCRIKPPSDMETGCLYGPEFIEDNIINNPVDCLEISVDDCIGPRISVINDCGIPFTMNNVEYEDETTDIYLEEGPYEYLGEINGQIFTISGRIVTPCD
jgi:hypothetical protein